MRLYMKLIILSGFLLLVSCSLSVPANAGLADQRSLAFVHVNVIPMTHDRVLTDQTVIVDKGRITQIGAASSIRLPRNARQINGRDKYLMPGLVDFHVHLRDQSELLSYLSHGVTTVVHLSGPMANVPDVLALRQKIIDREILNQSL